MPRLRNMLAETGRIEIPVPGDDPLIVVYRRGVMTPRLQARLALFQSNASTADPSESLNFFCELFGQMIQSWNMTDDEGQPLGTDGEALKDVPLEVLTAIAGEIGKAMSPDPLSDSGSSNGLSTPAGSEPLRITTA